MSEAELHVLRARLIGGQLNKARRGELWMRPPLGFVVDPLGHTVLDPDEHVQRVVRLLFDTFRQTGSAGAVVRQFREQGIAWPRRITVGPRRGTLAFGALQHHRVLGILHNPRYAGAYIYGRTRQRKVLVAGQMRYRRLPREEWKVFCRVPGPGTSHGKTSRPINRRCATTPTATGGTGVEARLVRAWPCSKGSGSAAGVGSG